MSDASSKIGPNDRKSTVDAVVDRLSVEILDGVLSPGEELRELELTARLGVSRATLREALAQMAFRGLLEREFQKSVRVRSVTVDDAADLFYMRSLLEGDAVRRITVDPSKWPHIEVALGRLESLHSQAPWSQVAEADIAFHRVLVQAAGSPRLAVAHDRLVDELRLLLSPGRHSAGVHDMVAAHRTLFDAIRTSDVEKAMSAVQHHLELGTRRIIEHLS